MASVQTLLPLLRRRRSNIAQVYARSLLPIARPDQSGSVLHSPHNSEYTALPSVGPSVGAPFMMSISQKRGMMILLPPRRPPSLTFYSFTSPPKTRTSPLVLPYYSGFLALPLVHCLFNTLQGGAERLRSRFCLLMLSLPNCGWAGGNTEEWA